MGRRRWGADAGCVDAGCVDVEATALGCGCGSDGAGARAYVGQRCQARVYVGLSGIEDDVGIRGVSSCAGVRW